MWPCIWEHGLSLAAACASLLSQSWQSGSIWEFAVLYTCEQRTDSLRAHTPDLAHKCSRSHSPLSYLRSPGIYRQCLGVPLQEPLAILQVHLQQVNDRARSRVVVAALSGYWSGVNLRRSSVCTMVTRRCRACVGVGGCARSCSGCMTDVYIQLLTRDRRPSAGRGSRRRRCSTGHSAHRCRRRC